MTQTLPPVRPLSLTWKASRYELRGGGYGRASYVEAAPDAAWTRADPFESYAPAPKRSERDDAAHVRFLNMKRLFSDRSRREIWDKALKLFADRYGLLGLLGETFASPVLPERVNQFVWFLAPDAVLDASGKMRDVDPDTEGKELLEEAVDLRDPRTRRKQGFRTDTLAFPHELRFPNVNLTPLGLLAPSFLAQQADQLSWEEVRDLYGVRVLLDGSAATFRKVTLVATREPVHFWDDEVKQFPLPPARAEVLNSRLDGVTPHGIATDDGSYRGGWRCPSLLKAMHLMLHLDQEAGNRILKCQAPGCPDYFRVEPKSRRTTYCPHPDDPTKQSKCASLSTSRASRARKRR